MLARERLTLITALVGGGLILGACSGDGGEDEPPVPKAPRIVIDSPAHLSVVQVAPLTVTGTIEAEAALSALRYTLNGSAPNDVTSALVDGAFTFDVLLANGVNTLTLAAVDADERTGSAALSVTLAPKTTKDVTPPVVAITEPTTGTVVTQPDVTIRGTATDDRAVAKLTWSLDSAGEQDATLGLKGDAYAFSVTLPAGAHTLSVFAWDAAGNRDAAFVTLTFDPPDSGPPVVTISAPTEGATVDTPTVTLEGTATDDKAVTSLSWRVDEGDERDATASLAAGAFAFEADIPPGTHVVTVTAMDAAGLEGSAELSLTRVEVLPAATVTVDPLDTQQVLSGWRVPADAGQVTCVDFDAFSDEVLDAAADTLGISRVRLDLYAGVERPDDAFSDLLAGTITAAAWESARFDAVNDDDAPETAAASGFWFSSLDHQVQHVVTPLRQRLEAVGGTLHVDLAVHDGAASDFEHLANPAELAELVAEAFAHLESTHGFVPDGVEIFVAPDTAGYDAPAVAAGLLAVAKRLQAATWSPEILAPSTAELASAGAYGSVMAATPEVTDFWTTLVYGRAEAAGPAPLQALASTSAAWGVQLGAVAQAAAGVEDALDDLTLADAAWWQRGPLATCDPDDAVMRGSWLSVDVSTAETPLVSELPEMSLVAALASVARPGTTRVTASSTDPSVRALATVDATGSVGVAVRASEGADLTIAGLPPGTYGVRAVRDDGTPVEIPDVAVAADTPVTLSLDGAGVIALTVVATP